MSNLCHYSHFFLFFYYFYACIVVSRGLLVEWLSWDHSVHENIASTRGCRLHDRDSHLLTVFWWYNFFLLKFYLLSFRVDLFILDGNCRRLTWWVAFCSAIDLCGVFGSALSQDRARTNLTVLTVVKEYNTQFSISIAVLIEIQVATCIDSWKPYTLKATVPSKDSPNKVPKLQLIMITWTSKEGKVSIKQVKVNRIRKVETADRNSCGTSLQRCLHSKAR